MNSLYDLPDEIEFKLRTYHLTKFIDKSPNPHNRRCVDYPDNPILNSLEEWLKENQYDYRKLWLKETGVIIYSNIRFDPDVVFTFSEEYWNSVYKRCMFAVHLSELEDLKNKTIMLKDKDIYDKRKDKPKSLNW